MTSKLIRRPVRAGAFLMLVLWAQAAVGQGFAGGDGGSENPFQIENWHHLNNVRNHLSSHFVLNNHLGPVAPGYTDWVRDGENLANDGKGWRPIGVRNEEFVGSFDGNGYVISDLHFSKTLQEGSGDAFGFFGFVGTSQASVQGVIQNVILSNIDFQISCANDPFLEPRISVGGLVGFKQNSIDVRRIEVSGSISVDADSCLEALFGSFDIRAGGIIGFHRAVLEKAYSAVHVTIETTKTENIEFLQAGGVVGFNQGRLTKVAFDGRVKSSVAGGITGFNDFEILDAYSVGVVTGGIIAGGLTGKNQGVFSRAYVAGTVSSPNDGGLAALVGETIRSDIGQASYWIALFWRR